MPSKLHPENLKDQKGKTVTDEIREFVGGLASEIEREQGQRGRWEQRVDELHKRRYGVRRRKTHPWPGASNFVIPLIDSDIQKFKPSYVNLAYGIDPIAIFKPKDMDDQEAEQSAPDEEQRFNHRMKNEVNFFEPYNYGIDMVLGAQGQTVFRIIWNFKSERYNERLNIADLPEQVIDVIFDPRVNDEMLFQIIVEELRIDLSFEENENEVVKAVEKFRNGTQEFDLDLMRVVDDQPDVIACDIKEDLVIPADTRDIQDARFIDYKFFRSVNDVKIDMENGKYEKFTDFEIESWTGKNKPSGTSGITSNSPGNFSSEELILLHETCVWYDINDDGIKERCITTWPDSDSTKVLRFIEVPYDHGRWPYEQVKREMTENVFYASRGIPSLDEDFQVGISTAVNQAVDNGTLLNTPERVARRGVLSNPRNRRYIPGELTEVNGNLSDYETRQTVNASQPILFQQAQFFKAWADNRTGQPSGGIGGQTDLPGLGERGKKTAKEVQTIVAMQSELQNYDLQVFQHQMAKVYFQVYSLYLQFRDNLPQSHNRWNIIPNGRFDNSNSALRFQKTTFAFNIGFGNPYIKQRELVEKVFRALDPSLAENILKTEEEINQESEMQRVFSAVMENEAVQKELGLKNVVDNMDIAKEVKLAALLEPIQGKKFAPD